MDFGSTIILQLMFLQLLYCKLEAASVNIINNPGNSHSELHNLTKRETYEQVFGESYGEYFHETDHTLIGSNVMIYKVSYQNMMRKYTILPYHKGASEFLENFLSESSASPKTYRDTAEKIVYPKLTIILDRNIYIELLADIEKTVEYVANFWTGVDLLFRQVQKPKIRLNIAKIFISTHRKAMPFISHNKTGGADFESSLIKMKKFLSHEKIIKFHTPDDDKKTIVVFMTTEDEEDAVGIAYSLYPCSKGLVIIHDKGDYSGITTAAHELAHVFGALHDKDPQYIMAENVPKKECGITRILFSEQSKSQIAKILENEKHNYCFNNPPDIGTPFKLKLPGTAFPHENQCKAALGPSALPDTVKSGKTRCEQLRCIKYMPADTSYSRLCADYNPLDGLVCKEENGIVKKICLRGKCVEKT